MIGADKGGISALRLAKFLGVSWLMAHRMLRKIRAAMGDRDRGYKRSDFIELSDGFRSMNAIRETQMHESRVTPGREAGKWLPWVHIVIGNLKTFLNGIFHGVSGGYLQEGVQYFVSVKLGLAEKHLRS